MTKDNLRNIKPYYLDMLIKLMTLISLILKITKQLLGREFKVSHVLNIKIVPVGKNMFTNKYKQYLLKKYLIENTILANTILSIDKCLCYYNKLTVNSNYII